MIDPGRWIPVPGAPGVDVYGIVPPTSIVNSSCWLLRAGAAVVVIDPGGSPAQSETVEALVRGEQKACPRPTLVVLTHCHLDHCAEAARLQTTLDALVCAEGSGADALARGDRLLTAAFAWGDELAVTPMHVPLRLVDPQTFQPDTQRTIALADGRAVTITFDVVSTQSGRALRRERIALGNGAWLEIQHTPGHSGCSVAVRCGELLFTGDLHFAVNPGLCGLPGWSQPALLDSFAAVAEQLRARPATLCCPGHGGAMPAATMQRILRAATREAQQLGAIDTIDERRMRMLTELTHAFIDEAWDLFTVISGRLYALSYHLGELQESAAAQRYLALLDSERIDDALTEFRHFRDSFDRQVQPELALVMKGVETCRRIQRLFSSPGLGELIEPSLLRRADRALTDLVSSVRGLRFASTAEAVAVNEVVEDVAARFGSFVVGDQALLDAVDDADRYVEALASRLVVPMALRGVRWTWELASALPPADVQRDRLADILTAVAEDLAGAGARTLHAATADADGAIAITLSAPQSELSQAQGEARLVLYDRTLATVGGSLRPLPSASGRAGVLVRLPRA